MRLYIRKDVADMVWNYGVKATELKPDPYAQGMMTFQADLVVGVVERDAQQRGESQASTLAQRAGERVVGVLDQGRKVPGGRGVGLRLRIPIPHRPGWHISSVVPGGINASNSTSSAARNRPVI